MIIYSVTILPYFPPALVLAKHKHKKSANAHVTAVPTFVQACVASDHGFYDGGLTLETSAFESLYSG